jgi:hypothetical protein
MNNKSRTRALAVTGGRMTAIDRGDSPGPNAKAAQPAGPPFNINQVQLNDVDVPTWMHGYFGHACGCGEKDY